jgi:hypothetical protein
MLTSENKILYIQNSFLVIEPIGEFIDRVFYDASQTDGIYTFNDSKKYFIQTTNEIDSKWSRIKSVRKRKYTGNVKKIITTSNRYVISTDISHVDTTVDIQLKSKQPKRTYVSVKFPVYSDKFYIKEISIGKKLILDENTGYIFGLYLANGELTADTVKIISHSTLDLYTAKSTGLKYYTVEYINSKNVKPLEIYFTSKEFWTLIMNSFGFGLNKKIPNFFHITQPEFIKSVIVGFISDLDVINIKYDKIELRSYNPNLLRGLCRLISRFNIICSFRIHEEYFFCEIIGDDYDNFTEIFLRNELDTDFIKKRCVFMDEVTQCEIYPYSGFMYNIFTENDEPYELYNGILIDLVQ